MLEIGWIMPHSCLIDGIEQIKERFSSIVIDSTGRYYRIYMRVDDCDLYDFFTFSIANINKTERLIK